MDRKPGRPRAIGEDMVGKVLAIHDGGLGYRAIARDLGGLGVSVDWRTIRRLIKAHAARPKAGAKGFNTILPLVI